MATGIVVKAWKDGAAAYASVVVAEGGQQGNVEYQASTPLADAAGVAKSAAQLKADLLGAVSAARAAQNPAAPTALAGVSGNVTV